MLCNKPLKNSNNSFVNAVTHVKLKHEQHDEACLLDSEKAKGPNIKRMLQRKNQSGSIPAQRQGLTKIRRMMSAAVAASTRQPFSAMENPTIGPSTSWTLALCHPAAPQPRRTNSR